MKRILVFVMVFISLSAFSQKLTKEKIDSAYQETLNNLDDYKRVLIVDTIQKGTVDTTFFYFKNDKIKYIHNLRCTGGLAMIESYIHHEYFFLDNNLVFIRYFGQWNRLEHGTSDQSTTSVTEQLTYLKRNGECLIQYYPRKAEGTRLTFMDNLKNTPLKVRDCMYFSPDTDESADKYIKKLIEKHPEYSYLLE